MDWSWAGLARSGADAVTPEDANNNINVQSRTLFKGKLVEWKRGLKNSQNLEPEMHGRRTHDLIRTFEGSLVFTVSSLFQLDRSRSRGRYNLLGKKAVWPLTPILGLKANYCGFAPAALKG